MKTYEQYLDWLLDHEGRYYENDPDDPGGETKFGIDKRSHPEINIKTLTEAGAKAIYTNHYWRAIRGAELPFPLNFVVMDIAVNNGVTRAIRWLQEAVGCANDGVFGPITMHYVDKAPAVYTTERLLDRREGFYRDIAKGSKRKFLKGWLNRNSDLRDFIS